MEGMIWYLNMGTILARGIVAKPRSRYRASHNLAHFCAYFQCRMVFYCRLSRWSGLMFTSGVTLIPTLSCQDKESAVYTTESHDNGIATLTEARCLVTFGALFDGKPNVIRLNLSTKVLDFSPVRWGRHPPSLAVSTLNIYLLTLFPFKRRRSYHWNT